MRISWGVGAIKKCLDFNKLLLLRSPRFGGSSLSSNKYMGIKCERHSLFAKDNHCSQRIICRFCGLNTHTHSSSLCWPMIDLYSLVFVVGLVGICAGLALKVVGFVLHVLVVCVCVFCDDAGFGKLYVQDARGLLYRRI